MKTTIINNNPKDSELLIPGMLLEIKIHYNSFSVFHQLGGYDKVSLQLCVWELIFPISCLHRFFKENGKGSKNHLVARPKELLEN